MLKSTHRPALSAGASDTLPDGWTEHKAPSGHTYYFNAATKQSTYKRPVVEPPEEELQIDYGATQPDKVVQASISALNEFNTTSNEDHKRMGQFTGGRSYQDRSRRDRYGDRPKSKVAIPNCEPWVLVKTKMGRRFVHNTETKESLWKFPSEVMMAVIDLDRVEWEAKSKAEEPAKIPAPEIAPTAPKPSTMKSAAPPPGDYDSDSYEEVEVTDDEGEGGDGDAESITKRQRRLDDEEQASKPPPGPVELTEDDIAWQLAAMEADDVDEDYGDDMLDYADDDDEEGLPVTLEDRTSLFRSLLDEYRINPYSTFDALIDTNAAASAIIEDPRWTSLPNMSSRRQTFTSWSRDRLAEQKAQEEHQLALSNDGTSNSNNKKRPAKKDPRIMYLRLLAEHATPKLYWPEFKRKFKKEAAMKDLNLQDKEREKLYREFIPKLKVSEADKKRELVALLKSIKVGDAWNRATSAGVEDGELPIELERDLRFYVLKGKQRDELVEAHVATLPDR